MLTKESTPVSYLETVLDNLETLYTADGYSTDYVEYITYTVWDGSSWRNKKIARTVVDNVGTIEHIYKPSSGLKTKDSLKRSYSTQVKHVDWPLILDLLDYLEFTDLLEDVKHLREYLRSWWTSSVAEHVKLGQDSDTSGMTDTYVTILTSLKNLESFGKVLLRSREFHP